MEKEKEVKEPEQDYYCDHCKALMPSSCFCDESFDDDNEFEDDEDFDECGMMADGTCSMIGSEYCDWECKHSRRTLWKK